MRWLHGFYTFVRALRRENPFLITRALLWLWQAKLTRSGRVYTGGLLVTTVLGSLDLGLPIFVIFCAWSALGACTFVSAYAARPRLAMAPDWPSHAVAGSPFDLRVPVRNRGRWAAAQVGVGFFGLPPGVTQQPLAGVCAGLAPGASETLDVHLLPAERGVHGLGRLRAFSTFPFGLLRTFGASSAPVFLTVVPAFTPLERLDLVLPPRYQPGGVALSSRVGESLEYIGHREFRPGDTTRHLDFRAWARLSTPVVREYQQEYFHRVAIVLDTYRPLRWWPRETDRDAAEAAISLCAAAAEALGRGETVIDVLAVGPRLFDLQAGRHVMQLDHVLDILAAVELVRDDPFEGLTPTLTDRLGRLSAAVFLLLDWDDARADAVRRAAEAGCQPRVVIVREGRTTRPLEEAERLAGEVRVCAPQDVHAGRVRAL